MFKFVAGAVGRSSTSVSLIPHSLFNTARYLSAKKDALFTAIQIDAINYINFKKIDPRIKSDGMWQETMPMRTRIYVPKDCAEDIISKLKGRRNILRLLSINTLEEESAPIMKQ